MYVPIQDLKKLRYEKVSNMLSEGLLRLVHTKVLFKILKGKLSVTKIQTLFKQFELFTETVIISLTDLLL